MKKKIAVCMVLLSLIVMFFAQAQAVQAATKVKAPTIKVTLNDDGNPVISWKKVSGATGYRVYRKTSNDTEWVKVVTTSKTKVVDTECNGEPESKVKYTVKAYVKANGKVTWSSNSKTVSVKLPAKARAKYTYKIEGANYCTYLDGKIVVKDRYDIPDELVDKNTTLKDLQEAGLVYSTYYYYDDKYVYEYSGATYFCYVYEVASDGSREQAGVYDVISFSPNKFDRETYLSYEDSMNEFKEFQKSFLAGELESIY